MSSRFGSKRMPSGSNRQGRGDLPLLGKLAVVFPRPTHSRQKGRITGVVAGLDDHSSEGVPRQRVLPGRGEKVRNLVSARGESIRLNRRKRADRQPGQRRKNCHDGQQFNQGVCGAAGRRACRRGGIRIDIKGDTSTTFQAFSPKRKKSFACLLYVFKTQSECAVDCLTHATGGFELSRRLSSSIGANALVGNRAKRPPS